MQSVLHSSFYSRTRQRACFRSVCFACVCPNCTCWFRERPLPFSPLLVQISDAFISLYVRVCAWCSVPPSLPKTTHGFVCDGTRWVPIRTDRTPSKGWRSFLLSSRMCARCCRPRQPCALRESCAAPKPRHADPSFSVYIPRRQNDRQTLVTFSKLSLRAEACT